MGNPKWQYSWPPVLTSLDKLLFILKMLFAFFKKQASLMRRWMVLSDPSPSVSDPCLSDSILSFVMLSVTVCKPFALNVFMPNFAISEYHYAECRSSECLYTEYRWSECNYADGNIVMLTGADRNIVMLSVVNLNVVMLSVVAPLNSFECCGSPWPYALLHQSGGRNNSGLEF
jgi:hypothetical protein